MVDTTPAFMPAAGLRYAVPSSSATGGAASCAGWRVGSKPITVAPLQREPGQDPYDVNGLQTLCQGYHLVKTAAESRRPVTPAEAAWRALVVEMLADKC